MFNELRETLNQEYERIYQESAQKQLTELTVKALNSIPVACQYDPDNLAAGITIAADTVLASPIIIRPRANCLMFTAVACLNPHQDFLSEILWTFNKHPKEAVYFAPLENVEYTIDGDYHSGQVMTVNLKLPLINRMLKQRFFNDLIPESLGHLKLALQRLYAGEYGEGGRELTDAQKLIPENLALNLR